MSNTTKIQSFTHVVPMIYAYNTPGVTYHEGWAFGYEVGLIVAPPRFLPPMHRNSRHAVGPVEESGHVQFLAHYLAEPTPYGGKLTVFHVVYGRGES